MDSQLNSNKAAVDHNHSGVYQPVGSYAAASHTHSEYVSSSYVDNKLFNLDFVAKYEAQIKNGNTGLISSLLNASTKSIDVSMYFNNGNDVAYSNNTIYMNFDRFTSDTTYATSNLSFKTAVESWCSGSQPRTIVLAVYYSQSGVNEKCYMIIHFDPIEGVTGGSLLGHINNNSNKPTSYIDLYGYSVIVPSSENPYYPDVTSICYISGLSMSGSIHLLQTW